MHLCPLLFFWLFFPPFLQIFLCLFPRLCSCVGGTSEAPSKLQTSGRSRVAQLCGDWSANPVENVIGKIVYNVSLWRLHQMFIVPLKGRQLWDSFLSLCQQPPFSFRLPFSTEPLRGACLLPQQLYSKPQDLFHLRNVLNESKNPSFPVILPLCVSDCSPSALPLPLSDIRAQSEHTGSLFQTLLYQCQF